MAEVIAMPSPFPGMDSYLDALKSVRQGNLAGVKASLVKP
jgi:hypothetical protein